MSIYHNGQKVAGYTSGRNSAILSNITLLPGEFKAQDDGTYMCTLDNTLVLDESIVDVYFASSSQKAGSKANIWVSSAAGKIYFHSKKIPTQGLVVETIRIVNPSQDDSYNPDQSAAIAGLQQPVFEDYDGVYPEETDTDHTGVNADNLPGYVETPVNNESLNYIIPCLGKIKSKNPIATVLEGVKGALSWSALLISNLRADVTKLQSDLSSHISDYRNKLSEVDKTTDYIKSAYKKRTDGSVSGGQGFNEFITQGQYSVGSNAGTGNGNPHDNWCYGTLLVFVNTGYEYNGQDNWLWQIFLQTDATIWQRIKINAGAWSSWKQIA